MVKTNFVIVIGVLLFGITSPAAGQQPGQLSANPAQIIYGKESVPMPMVHPAQPSLAHPVMAPDCCQTCPTKVCVPEVKKNTKTVYATKCKDYCQTSCMDLLRRAFGGDCNCTKTCGEVKTKKVLIKKTVPDCDTIHCVVKDACTTKP